jgi:hypothetical protein
VGQGITLALGFTQLFIGIVGLFPKYLWHMQIAEYQEVGPGKFGVVAGEAK